MNSACSACLESFNLREDISTTPCGHVFHTKCIEKWLQSGNSQCPQCRKYCGPYRLIKLFFSMGESENHLIQELEKTIERLQGEVNELKSINL